MATVLVDKSDDGFLVMCVDTKRPRLRSVMVSFNKMMVFYYLVFAEQFHCYWDCHFWSRIMSTHTGSVIVPVDSYPLVMH